MPNIRWLSLEIGYESTVPDTCGKKPALQTDLETVLPLEALYEWALGSVETVADVSTDEWVASFLQTRINAALAARHALHNRPGTPDELVITEDDLCGYLFQGEKRRTRSWWSGSPGTRCKLRGKVWVNSRSYALLKADGEMWMKGSVPKDAIVFATLTWECHAVVEGNLRAAAAHRSGGSKSG